MMELGEVPEIIVLENGNRARLASVRDKMVFKAGYDRATEISQQENAECHWCGRNDTVGSVTDIWSDRYYWCSRHEDMVKSMID